LVSFHLPPVKYSDIHAIYIGHCLVQSLNCLLFLSMQISFNRELLVHLVHPNINYLVSHLYYFKMTFPIYRHCILVQERTDIFLYRPSRDIVAKR
jgi:hypothetical protein